MRDKDENARKWEASHAAATISSLAAWWFILVPFIFEFGHIRLALWNSVVIGSIVLTLSIIRLRVLGRRIWPRVLSLAFAAWLVIAPYVLGYGDMQAALWNSILTGVVIGAMALWSIRDAPEKDDRIA